MTPLPSVLDADVESEASSVVRPVHKERAVASAPLLPRPDADDDDDDVAAALLAFGIAPEAPARPARPRPAVSFAAPEPSMESGSTLSLRS